MPTGVLALVILAGLIHACWNIAAKQAGGDYRFAFFTACVLMVVWAPVGVGVGWKQIPQWGWLQWCFLLASAVVHVLYYVVLLRGYRLADLTVVYPLARGFGPLLSSLVAIVFWGEAYSLWSLTGLLCVVAGIFMIAGGVRLFSKKTVGPSSKLPPEQSADPSAVPIAGRMGKGIFYGCCTGFFIASYTLIDGYAVKKLHMSPLLLDYWGNLIRLLLLLPWVLRQRNTLRPLWRLQWKQALLVGVVSPVSYVMVLYAMQIAPLSHVAPLREISMLFAALIGGHLLREGDRVGRMLGAVLIALGVFALARA
jgi:drug/metabolite transporter (DMT)-like permease